MTTVAWDGRTMAADKQMTYGSISYSVRKVHRIRGHLVGTCGESAWVGWLLEWFERGADMADPVYLKAAENATMLVVDPQGRVFGYFAGGARVLIEDRCVAIGSGSDLARMAMHLGKSAFEAIRLSMELAHESGRGIDVMEHEGPAAPDLHVVGSDAPQWN